MLTTFWPAATGTEAKKAPVADTLAVRPVEQAELIRQRILEAIIRRNA